MKLFFIDLISWDYDVQTPYESPLGGSQSALCYLAVELARRGHDVTLMCGTSRPGRVSGVRCITTGQPIPPDVLQQPLDAVIVLNGPADMCFKVREIIAKPTPLVLWNQHAPDQKAMAGFGRAEVRAGWDAIVCVSDWHRQAMIAAFGLDPARVQVVRNAIGPAFSSLFRDEADLVAAKTGPAVLAYTSTPFRGLDVLIQVFPRARQEFPDLELHIYSSMKVYQVKETSDPYAALYQQSRSLPGVRYVGSMAQPALAQELRKATLLAYPNTFAETSCIAVMEALAAGLYVVTSDLGALPETTMGFSRLFPPMLDPAGRPAFAETFLAHLRNVLGEWYRDSKGFAAARFPQVRAINERCTWSRQAREWEVAIAGWRA